MIEESHNKNLYQEDKNCVICDSEFGNEGLIMTKKYFCEACFRGVCEKCLENLVDGSQACKNCCSSLYHYKGLQQEQNKNDTFLSENIESDKFSKIQKEIDEITEKIKIADGQDFENNEKTENFQEIEEKKTEIIRKKQKLNKKLKKLESFKAEFQSKDCSDQLKLEKQINDQLKQELLLSKSFETLNLTELEKTLEDLKENIETQSGQVKKLKNCIESPEIPQEYVIKQLEYQKARIKSLYEQLLILNSIIY